jgi:hypothetical protein
MAPRTHIRQFECEECGIDRRDGYCIDCRSCQKVRASKVSKGIFITPNGRAFEAIDNRPTAGRIIFWDGATA